MRYRMLITLGLGLLLAACSAQAQAPSWPGLAANEQLVFVANSSQVHALNLSDLKTKWTFPLQADSHTGAFQIDPAVSADLVVVGAQGPANNYSGAIFGLDPNTGVQKWCLVFDDKGATQFATYACTKTQTHATDNAADNRPVAGASIAEGDVYFGLASGIFYAVDAATGAERWSFQAKRDIWAAPTVTTDTVYLTSLDHHVYALDRATGKSRWEKDLGAAVAGTPLVENDHLYIGSFGNAFYALDVATGAQQWVYTTTNWVWSGPTLADGVLYFTDVSGMVFAVDAQTGTQKWAVSIGQSTRAHPAVAEGLVLVAGRDGMLFALNQADGAPKWQQKLEGQLLTAPVVAGTDVLVAPYNGQNLLVAHVIASGAQHLVFKP